MSKKVLVIATSSHTRGGITSVVKAHKSCDFWNEWNCIWIETHIDKSSFIKLTYFLKSVFIFLFNLFDTSIVHIHLSGPVSVRRKLIFIYLSKLFKKQLIIHFHAFSEKSNIDINFKKLYKKIFGSADKIFVLSNSWKTGLVEDLNISESKIDVIYNPCPNIEYLSTHAKEKTILFAGTLNQRKNFKTLIKAFSLIAKDFPEWKLVFAGNGDIEGGKSLAKSLKIYAQVVFKGWVVGEEKHKLFSSTSIFCLPSYAEGFPMSILDAWAYGIPIITTEVGGIPEVALDGENMILFNPDDFQYLAQKLKQLIMNEVLQTKLSKAALSFANNQFSLKRIESDIREIYESCSKL